MRFEVAIFSEAENALPDLPALVRVEALRFIHMMQTHGPQCFGYKALTWITPSQFEVSFSRNPENLTSRAGAWLSAHVRTGRGGGIFIDSLARRRPSRIQELPPPEEVAGYKFIDNKWFEPHLDDPFADAALKPLEIDSFTQDLLPVMRLQKRFFRTFDQIDLSKQAEDLHGFPPWISPKILEKNNPNAKHHGWIDKSGDLKSLIDQACTETGRILIANFIDESDALSRAQAEYINGAAICILTQSPDIAIHIVDVSIRGKNGRTRNTKLFNSYLNDLNLHRETQRPADAPFSMVFGRPAFPTGEMKDGSRWFDIDLGNRCRQDGQTDLKTRAYLALNIQHAMFDLMQAAQYTNAGEYRHEARDFRSRSDDEARRLIRDILRYTAVIVFNADIDSKLGTRAREAASAAIATGELPTAIVATNLVGENELAVVLDHKAHTTFPLDPDLPLETFRETALDGVFKAYGTNHWLRAMMYDSYPMP